MRFRSPQDSVYKERALAPYSKEWINHEAKACYDEMRHVKEQPLTRTQEKIMETLIRTKKIQATVRRLATLLALTIQT